MGQCFGGQAGRLFFKDKASARWEGDYKGRTTGSKDSAKHHSIALTNPYLVFETCHSISGVDNILQENFSTCAAVHIMLQYFRQHLQSALVKLLCSELTALSEGRGLHACFVEKTFMSPILREGDDIFLSSTV